MILWKKETNLSITPRTVLVLLKVNRCLHVQLCFVFAFAWVYEDAESILNTYIVIVKLWISIFGSY